MNGRVYDYNLGRFMSVDPLIQGHGNSQGINPYSYIMNNPMSGTDPTGYKIEVTGSKIKVDEKSVKNVNGTATVGGSRVSTSAGISGSSKDKNMEGNANNGADNTGNQNNNTPQENTDLESQEQVTKTEQTANPRNSNDVVITSVTIVYNQITGYEDEHHAYIFIKSSEGEIWAMRAGPGADGPSNLAGNIINLTGVDGSSGEGFYGNIDVSFGKAAIATEALKESVASKHILTTEESFSSVKSRLRKFGDAVNDSEIHYDPLFSNSNAFAHQAVTTLGVRRPSPPSGISAPGHGTVLEVGQ